jgi:NADH-quinone oxidoreductase subunit K
MTTNHFIILSSIIFLIGLFGLVTRRNILIILMSIELMLTGVNIALVAFSKELQGLGGQMAVFFVITVAAAESAVGLGLLIAMYRNLKSVSTEKIQYLKL